MVKRVFIAAAFLALFTFGNIAWSEAPKLPEVFRLTDANEIKAASELNMALKAITEKVMACIKQNEGKTEGCLCATYDACKFKTEYAHAKAKYCEAIAKYPSWKGKAVNYSLPQDSMSYALGMVGLEMQFGKDCR